MPCDCFTAEFGTPGMLKSMFSSSVARLNSLSVLCEGTGDVVGVKAPFRGVAQVVFHGVQVVEVDVQGRVHQDRGVEEDGEGQVEVEREVSEDQGETLMHDMRMTMKTQ